MEGLLQDISNRCAAEPALVKTFERRRRAPAAAAGALGEQEAPPATPASEGRGGGDTPTSAASSRSSGGAGRGGCVDDKDPSPSAPPGRHARGGGRRSSILWAAALPGHAGCREEPASRSLLLQRLSKARRRALMEYTRQMAEYFAEVDEFELVEESPGQPATEPRMRPRSQRGEGQQPAAVEANASSEPGLPQEAAAAASTAPQSTEAAALSPQYSQQLVCQSPPQSLYSLRRRPSSLLLVASPAATSGSGSEQLEDEPTDQRAGGARAAPPCTPGGSASTEEQPSSPAPPAASVDSPRPTLPSPSAGASPGHASASPSSSAATGGDLSALTPPAGGSGRPGQQQRPPALALAAVVEAPPDLRAPDDEAAVSGAVDADGNGAAGQLAGQLQRLALSGDQQEGAADTQQADLAATTPEQARPRRTARQQQQQQQQQQPKQPPAPQQRVPSQRQQERRQRQQEQQQKQGQEEQGELEQQRELEHLVQQASAEAAAQQLAELQLAAAVAAQLTPLQQMLQACSQLTAAEDVPCMRDFMAPLADLRSVVKLGEGTYGEAFRAGEVVFKLVPMEGSNLVNGWPQKRAGDLLGEAVIALALSALAEEAGEDGEHRSHTRAFVRTHGVGVVRGPYPQAFVKAWRAWDARHGSENDPVDGLPPSQLYAVFAMANCGRDLEGFQLAGFDQARSMLLQVALALAVAEDALAFEHRDLHWGNVMLRPAASTHVSARLRGCDVRARAHGVEVALIDFTASRLQTPRGDVAFCDLEQEEGLFEGPKGKPQFETYRRMRKLTRGDWAGSHPGTNVLWLQYLAELLLGPDKPIPGAGGAHKRRLREFKRRLGGYGSCGEALWDELFEGLWSVVDGPAATLR